MSAYASASLPAADAEDEEERKKLAAQQARGKRGGVAAAAASVDDVKDYAKPEYPKSPDTAKSLTAMVKNNQNMQVLVGHLSDSQMADVINAFYKMEFEPESKIIQQGDEGTCLYLIEEGSVDIFVARPGPDGKVAEGDVGSKVASWSAGMLFGELALMYNAPRAATVIAKSKVTTWALNSIDYRMLLVKLSSTMVEKYSGWLCNVELFKALNHFELGRLAETEESKMFEEDEIILKQGDLGDELYILDEGDARAFVNGDQGEIAVKSYTQKGDYFGELALLDKAPRTATVKAGSEGCIVSCFTKDNFERILGPVKNSLPRAQYKPIAEFK